MRTIRLLTALILAFALLDAVPANARARRAKPGPNCYKEFKGKIILDTKEFPEKFRTGKACVRYMKPRNLKDKFHRSPSRDWNLYMFAFFNEPIGGDEFTMQIYKINGEEETFVTEETYPISPRLKTFFGQITLSEDEFEVGPTYEMRATRDVGDEEKVYARKKFTLLEMKPVKKKRTRKRK
ncbi:MAG: hypothetical protein GXP49_07255 [Deltaproteobacteria bacterium]|nr:hypothetical protein [Deltaproteobacteria bacterium]